MARRFSESEIARLRNKLGENVPVPKERKKPSNEESKFQQAGAKWWTFACAKYGLPELALMAHPSQGFRTIVNATRMKAEGARKGVPDMQLTVAKGGFHGLWIENKTESGKLSDAQISYRDHLIKQGYDFRLCRSFDEIKRAIEAYLSQ